MEQIFNVGHLCCGSGFGAKGFRKANARVGNLTAKFQNIGGIDVDPAGIRDFERFAGVKGTVLDLMNAEQYEAFHGKKPPADWREAIPEDIQRAMGFKRPHIWFVSAPCKGFSGLLPEKTSKHARYQALNQLALRAVWLAMEAYNDDPVEFFLFENVPRIATRGRTLLDEIQAILAHFGYAFAETTHDCGELGGLAQSRKRFLMVARHMEKVPPFLYEPPKRRLRGVGEVLSQLPVPSTETIGGMHRLPALQWKTWVRLAFVEAGADWRSLNKLKVEDGVLADYGIVPDTQWRQGPLGVLDWDKPAGTITGNATATTGRFNVADPRPVVDWHRETMGVQDWEDTAGTVTGNARPGTGRFSVADPRTPGARENQQYGVRKWEQSTGAVINVKSPGQGTFAVADPRTPRRNGALGVADWNSHSGTVAGESLPSNGNFAVADPRIPGKPRFNNTFRIVPFEGTAPAVAGPGGPGGGLAVSDPRARGSFEGGGKYKVTAFQEPAGTVIGGSTTGQGAFSVADPRPDAFKDGRKHFQAGGHYGVVSWSQYSGAVIGTSHSWDNGRWSVADPRETQVGENLQTDQNACLPEPDQKIVAHITALDGTWHRPFTTLELAALQSLFDPEEWAGFEMDGKSDSAWRERIGNAVPPDAATAIASVMGRTLLLAMTGETFMLSSDPIWVQPLTIALSVDTEANTVRRAD
ncbi:DNA cytosine methyltransferase [Labrenzia sp. R5_0]|uniref:DNA cytosine methyltransferase n=1 Tax=Labrenzia sp. R5_0 TaxID=2821108 RepID=UPI001AD9CBB7|nr:DNA cytosine methyltransferase [Labrenzia sp. R5_0]MBO9459006.1 DNA cytosine methyltransferase [Labrenzia sp. R5_0]